MTKKDHIVLAAALLEVRPFISETQYHRMKQNRTAPGYFLILQWENCVNSVCRAMSRDNERFNASLFLQAAGFIVGPTPPPPRRHH